MSFSAAREIKEQIRDSVDIVDLVGGYLELRSDGRNYAALCPWHDDSRPSLKVNRERQSWKCWVCDEGGDIFSFVMKFENVDFREALELLADRAGISLASPRQTIAAAGTVGDKPLLYRALSWAEGQYHECLLRAPQAAAARDYLANRGISADSIKAFHLGFAPAGWQWLVDRARATEFTVEILEAVDLVTRSARSARPYDRFRERLLFPIRDAQSRPVAFGGRILPGSKEDNPAKYINTAETRLFSKRDQLYGLDRARDQLRRSDNAVVVEGYTDVVMAHQSGLTNVVAVLGTALGENHVHLLRRYVNHVTLVLDGDEAGQRRANAILELFVGSPLDLRIATLPVDEDPCDFLRQRGIDPFSKLVAAAPNALMHKLRRCTQGLNLAEDVHGASQALEEILTALAQVPNRETAGVNPWAVKVPLILTKLSQEFRIGENDLRMRLDELRRRRPRGLPAAGDMPAEESREKPPPLHPWDRKLIQLLIRAPDLAATAMQVIRTDQLRSPAAQPIYAVIQGYTESGDTPEFLQLMSALDEPEQKALLAELGEEADRLPAENTYECFDELVESYQDHHARRRIKNSVTHLESHVRQLSPQEQLEELHEIVRQQQDRQGISTPTDGS